MGITTQVGRSLLKAMDGVDSVYASDPQFIVNRDEAAGAWMLEHHPAARNPTFYNGAAVGSTPCPLATDGIISIGPERLRLRVNLEDA
jgi:hypothetical protein